MSEDPHDAHAYTENCGSARCLFAVWLLRDINIAKAIIAFKD